MVAGQAPRVYEDGEVKKLGELALKGQITVMQAIARAEEATEKA